MSASLRGLSGSVPRNALSGEDIESAVTFIQNFADVNGLPQPAAPRGHNKPAPTYLPCLTTMKMLHANFITAGGKCPTEALQERGIPNVPTALL